MNSLANDNGVETCNSDDTSCNNNMLSVNGIDNNSATPNTPEIINALTKINPLDDYLRHNSPTVEDKLFSPADYSNSADTCSSNSNLGSPSSPVNVQKNMHSQFIKEELKVRLQQKARKNNAAAAAATTTAATATTPICAEQPVICSVLGYDECSLDLDEYDGNSSNSETFKSSANCELTPEDEERRLRRRERNKIAASRCRQKKRLKTARLEEESVKQGNLNSNLKCEIEKLEVQRRQLENILNDHKPTCIKPSPEQSPVVDYQQPPSFLPATDNGTVSNTANSLAAAAVANTLTPVMTGDNEDSRRRLSVTSAIESLSRQLPLQTSAVITGTYPSLNSFAFGSATTALPNSLVKNPSIVLSMPNDSRIDYGEQNGFKKNIFFSPTNQMNVDSNFKNDIPSLSFGSVVDSNVVIGNNYDFLTYMETSDSGLTV